MLDFDLTEMYGMETKVLKQSVKRNLKRFPSDFMFELTKEEYASLRSQIVTLKKGRGQHSKYMPFAFTELGVAMLSSILNSDIAIEVNIAIMRAFVEPKAYLEEVFTDQNDINEDTRMQLELINQTLAEMQAQRKLAEKPRNPIGFKVRQ